MRLLILLCLVCASCTYPTLYGRENRSVELAQADVGGLHMTLSRPIKGLVAMAEVYGHEIIVSLKNEAKKEFAGKLTVIVAGQKRKVEEIAIAHGEIIEVCVDYAGTMPREILCDFGKRKIVLTGRDQQLAGFDEYSFEKKFYRHKIKASGPYDALYRSPWTAPPDPFVE